jgi:hypothetical protein
METYETSTQSSPNALKMLNALLSIGAGEIIENTLNKVILYQLAKYREIILQTKREIEVFEKNYDMSSDVFYREFEAGNLGDDGDFFEWSSLYENVLLYENRIKKMEAFGKQ